jgi:hypothetical protein
MARNLMFKLHENRIETAVWRGGHKNRALRVTKEHIFENFSTPGFLKTESEIFYDLFAAQKSIPAG